MKILFRGNKELNNASWLIAGKVIQMSLSLLIGVWTARYLGPGNYGTINYANSYVAFFMAFCTLGINSVIIKVDTFGDYDDNCVYVRDDELKVDYVILRDDRRYFEALASRPAEE